MTFKNFKTRKENRQLMYNKRGYDRKLGNVVYLIQNSVAKSLQNCKFKLDLLQSGGSP